MRQLLSFQPIKIGSQRQLGLDVACDGAQRHRLGHRATLDRFLGHAIDDSAFFILANRQRACLAHFPQAAGADKARQLKVVWKDRLKVPVLVESVSGASSKKTVVEIKPPGKTLPWQVTQQYTRKDYSDYLD